MIIACPACLLSLGSPFFGLLLSGFQLRLLSLTPFHKVYSDLRMNIPNGPSLLESLEYVIHQFNEYVLIIHSVLAFDTALVKKEKQKLS